ncbi:MAG: leucine-rich repeat protein [Ancrocorticia sp.]|uniref:leucine-rich repeat protein n=1 Tax=Ancrocorticia sp. TaxID=2593684 RepID=UPI003F918BD6
MRIRRKKKSAEISPTHGLDDPLAALDAKAIGPQLTASEEDVERIAVTNPAASYVMVPGVGSILSSGTRDSGTAVVPPAVGGLPLLWVGRAAYSSKGIAAVFFSGSLHSIGRAAFFKCRHLKTVLFTDTIEYIGRSAFAYCTELETVELPAGLRTLGKRAFRGCERLRHVTIYETVAAIDDGAFEGCAPDLVIHCVQRSFADSWARRHGINVIHDVPEQGHEPSANAPKEFVEDGIMYRSVAPGTAEVRGVIDHEVASLTIPGTAAERTVTGIGPRACYGLMNLEEVTLPRALQYIGAEAFQQCPSLKAVNGLLRVSVVSMRAGLESFTQRKSPQGKHDVDADYIRLTPRMVSQMLEIPLPEDAGVPRDSVFSEVAAGELSSSRGSLYFCRTLPSPELLDRLLERGIAAFVASAPVRSRDGRVFPTFIHPNPEQGFLEICSWIASQNFAKTIAITGSVGKTTTKEMIQLVCSAGFRSIYSKGNQNGVAQVGRYIQKVALTTEVLVQETGAAHPGLIESDARMLHPDAFVVTNIGLNHVGNYGGKQENILNDKMSHDKHLPENGVAFINYDDEKLRAYSVNHAVTSYGIESRDTSYYADEITESDGEIHFDIVESSTESRSPTIVHSFGRYNASNAVVAFAVGRWLGIPERKIVAAIGKYRGEGLRQNLVELGGQRVLVDCYNASETAIVSTAEALRTITVGPNGRRILVFADIDDKLGDVTEEVHRRVGRAIAAMPNIDLFVCFGEHAGWSAEEARKAGAHVYHTVDRHSLTEKLRAELQPSDVIAFKGGQQMALSITIDSLFGSSFVLLDGDVLVKRGTQTHRNGLLYRHIREFGTEMRRMTPEFAGNTVHIEPELDGEPVLMVGKLACSGRPITSVKIPEPVRTIAQSAFFRCAALTDVSLPSTLQLIGRSAFNGCISLADLEVPDGVATIEQRAFFGCSNLRHLDLPATVKTIGADAFKGCDQLEIRCPKGSWVAGHLAKEWPDLSVTTY